jgi:hypothetical protein
VISVHKCCVNGVMKKKLLQNWLEILTRWAKSASSVGIHDDNVQIKTERISFSSNLKKIGIICTKCGFGHRT